MGSMKDHVTPLSTAARLLPPSFCGAAPLSLKVSKPSPSVTGLSAPPPCSSSSPKSTGSRPRNRRTRPGSRAAARSSARTAGARGRRREILDLGIDMAIGQRHQPLDPGLAVGVIVIPGSATSLARPAARSPPRPRRAPAGLDPGVQPHAALGLRRAFMERLDQPVEHRRWDAASMPGIGRARRTRDCSSDPATHDAQDRRHPPLATHYMAPSSRARASVRARQDADTNPS